VRGSRGILQFLPKPIRKELPLVRYLLVLAGGALGTGLRYSLSSLIYSAVREPTFPYANLVINVSGSFMIGLLAELFEARGLVSPTIRVVDSADKINSLLPIVDEMVQEGMVTVEKVRVIQYRHKPRSG
jgi:Uncharacterized ACR, COG1993